jgi:SpoVK/Ycf46/Vps4 family AAA+-type ATPase
VYQNSDRRDRFGHWVPQDPSAAQIRQNLTEYAVLPLGSNIVRSKTPHVRSVMLYGPKGSGKTMLVSAIAKETGALLLNLSPSNLVGKFSGKNGPTKLIHMAFLLGKASQYQPILIYIDECEQIFQGGSKKKISSEGPTRFKKDLVTYIKALEKEDRLFIIGTSSDPSLGDPKEYKSFFDKFLHIPYPDYASRMLLWKTCILETIKKHAKILGIKAMVHDELNLSTLAHISEGYSSGGIVKAIETTLTSRRVECLDKRKLREDEFIGALSRETATFVDDNEKFKAFTAIITGLKETRDKIRQQAIENAGKGQDEKKKDKKKK